MTPAQYLEATTAIAYAWPWFWPLVGGILGSVMGSFLECAAYRVPRGISMRQPPSMCPSCSTRLGVLDLVPIVSYVALGGKCRHCGTPIGRKALWLEITSTIIGALVVYAVQTYFMQSAV